MVCKLEFFRLCLYGKEMRKVHKAMACNEQLWLCLENFKGHYHFKLADPAPFLAAPQCKPLLIYILSVATIRFCQKRLIQLPFNWGDDIPDKVSFFFFLCVTGAPLLFLRILSSTFFLCLSVSEWGIGVTQTNCVTRAPLLYFIRSWVALSFKVCEWVSQARHR